MFWQLSCTVMFWQCTVMFCQLSCTVMFRQSLVLLCSGKVWYCYVLAIIMYYVLAIIMYCYVLAVIYCYVLTLMYCYVLAVMYCYVLAVMYCNGLAVMYSTVMLHHRLIYQRFLLHCWVMLAFVLRNVLTEQILSFKGINTVFNEDDFL